MEFTTSQKLAIELKDRNILVSAAAGSGKTATLTERIIRALTDEADPADITSMLIVTFTRAAAGELRTRISRALSAALSRDPSNKHIARQLTSLGSANICTIDAYYLDLVRSNFQRLDLSARFRLADETELAYIRAEVMNAVIERRYEVDAEFVTYADQLTTARGEGQLSDILLELAQKLIMLPSGTAYLADCAEEYHRAAELDYFDTASGRSMLQALREEVKYLIHRSERLIKCIDMHSEAAAYGPAVSADTDHLKGLYELLCGAAYADARAYLYDYSPINLGRISAANKSEVTEEIKEERNSIKKRLLELRDREFSALPEDIPRMAELTRKFCLKTKEILDEYFEAYRNEKSTRGICEFADLRKYAMELLLDADGKPTQIAAEERKKYKAIFVDEYQDTDAIQDLVFRTISNGANLFFVGDIKQSIYSFRGAEPSLFASYRKSYRPADGSPVEAGIPLSVFMSENFRCSPNIISFTNAVCSYLFRETDSEDRGIGYVAEDDLIAARGEPISDERVKLVMLEVPEERKDCDIEAAYLIKEIDRLLKDGKRADGGRLLPGDIAILTRSNKEAMRIAEQLAQAGIPHANSTGVDLFENQEVLLMLCLLTAADNPQRDIPLAGALRSPLFGFTMSELINIRCGRSEMSLYDAVCDYAEESDSNAALRDKCRSAIERIDRYRREAEATPVYLFMRYVWKDTNALSFAGSDEKTVNRTPMERRRNLHRLYEYARRFEASSFKGLHEFIEYINDIISRGTKITGEDVATDNTVRIMTVHKSKGLEFPVVFLVGCDKQIGEQDSRKPILFTASEHPGLACKVSDPSGLTQLDTPFRQTIASRLSEISSEEEIRVLYVALTRARDMLYVLASGKSGFAEKRLSNAARLADIGGRQTVLGSTRWLERILVSLAATPTERSYTIEIPNTEEFTASAASSTDRSALDENEIREIREKLRPILEFKYPDDDFSDIPAKISVSKLYPELLNEEREESELITKAQSMETRRPRFTGEGDNAAQKGTATHLFLQFCDFERLKPDLSSVEKEIGRLIEQRYITAEIAELIRVNEIVRLADSGFFGEILKAERVYRELRFNVFMPAADFTTDMEQASSLGDKEILVQGVIDLCFIDQSGKIILCDYKTDRLSKALMNDRSALRTELLAKHGQQLKYYSRAVEQIFGRKPDRTMIYSLALGDAVELTV